MLKLMERLVQASVAAGKTEGISSYKVLTTKP
jgi:hypothetical protein